MRLFARLLQWLRRKPQPEVLDERLAYERCHGRRVGDVHIVVAPVPTPPRLLPHLRGDYLRRCFEERLERRRRVHS